MVSRGRRLSIYYKNQTKTMPLFATTSGRYILQEMEALQMLQCKVCFLPCPKQSALACLVPMVQARPLLLVWSVQNSLFGLQIHVYNLERFSFTLLPIVYENEVNFTKHFFWSIFSPAGDAELFVGRIKQMSCRANKESIALDYVIGLSLLACFLKMSPLT